MIRLKRNKKIALFVTVFSLIAMVLVLLNIDKIQNLREKAAELADQNLQEHEPKTVPGQVIIKIKDSSKVSLNVSNLSALEQTNLPLSVQEVGQKRNLKKASKVFNETGRSNAQGRGLSNAAKKSLGNYYLLEFPSDQPVSQLIREIKYDPNIEFVQPNYEMETFFAPTDPYFYTKGAWKQTFGNLWGLQKDKLVMETAWDINKGLSGTGNPIVVAVVDTGSDANHEDLWQNIWTNTKEIAANGKDDDGNGFIDDTKGWNFYSNTNNINDDNGHGTHVAGTIAAVANNVGIIGVAPSAKIMSVKALSASGSGGTVGLANGILYAAMNGAQVINNSWGCVYGCPSNPIVEEAVRAAYDLGVITVFAAGNSNATVDRSSPQNMVDHKPVVVAASDYLDKRAFFSNFGYKLDVAAPGVEVLSLKAANGNICTLEKTVGVKYCILSGTSMAAPHVSGLVALIKATKPTYTNEEVRAVLQSGVDDIDTPGIDIYTSWGRINADKTLRLPQPLTANITSPTYDQSFYSSDSSNVNIVGSANGINFQYYQLQYTESNSLNMWKELTPRKVVPVTNGTLGTLPISNIANGVILVRLDVYSKDGVRTSDLININRASDITLLQRSDQQLFPKAYGRNLFWLSSRYLDPQKTYSTKEVVMYSLDTKVETVISDSKHSVFWAPSAWGDKVVWAVDYSADATYTNTFIVKDLKTGVIQKVKSIAGAVAEPVISGNYVAYRSKIPSMPNYGVYAHDLTTGQTTTISTKASGFSEVGIYNNIVVWEDYRSNGTSANIYGYDLTSRTEFVIASNSYHEFSPRIYEKNVIWIGSKTGDGKNVFLYNLDTKQTKEIATGSFSKIDIDMSQNKIVWRERDGVSSGIYVYDMLSGLTSQILTSDIGPDDISVYDNVVMWVEQNYIEPNENSLPLFDIYYSIIGSAGASPTPGTVTQKITVRFDFQGVSGDMGDKDVVVGLWKSQALFLEKNVKARFVNGKYQATVDAPQNASYQVTVRTDRHLTRKRSGSVAIRYEDKTVEFPNPLLGGDITSQDIANQITLSDYNSFLQLFDQPAGVGDFNYDGVVDLKDFNILQVNYGLVGE